MKKIQLRKLDELSLQVFDCCKKEIGIAGLLMFEHNILALKEQRQLQKEINLADKSLVKTVHKI